MEVNTQMHHNSVKVSYTNPNGLIIVQHYGWSIANVEHYSCIIQKYMLLNCQQNIILHQVKTNIPQLMVFQTGS